MIKRSNLDLGILTLDQSRQQLSLDRTSKKWETPSIANWGAGLAVRASVVVALVLAAGCARWYEKSVHSDPPKTLTTTLQSSGTVDLETVIVRFSMEQTEGLEQLWQSTDEAAVDFGQRRTLDANGIRVGILRGEMPAVLQKQLDLSMQKTTEDVSEASGLGSDADARMRLIRCRAGRRKELIIRREISRPLSVITSIDGLIAGQTFYEQATTLLALMPFPNLDTTAKIELVPEVQYGQPQNRYLTTDFGVRQEARRPTKVWKQLKISATLGKGDVLVVAATQPPKSLGGAFFVSETLQQTEEHLVLLIRLSETPMDDLFADDSVASN